MNKIFAFEGHNGVGKSSVARQVAANIKAKYLYGVDEDTLIAGLKEKFIQKSSWYSSALFFLAGSMETKRRIENEYKENIFILDRSFWSTLAVHWDRSESDKKQLESIVDYGKQFLPIPNIIFILTADYEECKKRINMKKDCIEKDLDSVVDEKYYLKEKYFYNWLLENNSEETKIIKIDTTTKSEDEIINICTDYIEKYIKENR